MSRCDSLYDCESGDVFLEKTRCVVEDIEPDFIILDKERRKVLNPDRPFKCKVGSYIEFEVPMTHMSWGSVAGRVYKRHKSPFMEFLEKPKTEPIIAQRRKRLSKRDVGVMEKVRWRLYGGEHF